MNKFKIYIYLYYSSFIIWGCSNYKTENKSTDKSKIEIIDINPKSNISEDDFINSISEIKYIPLKSDNNSLIAEMSKVIQYDNDFYILDKKYAAIRIFSSKGDFKKSISNIGSGPGQFISLNGFDIDVNNKEIIIYSSQSMKILYLKLDGTFVREKKIVFFGYDFLLNENQQKNVFFVNNNPVLDKKNYNLLYTDENIEIKNNFFPFVKESCYAVDFSGGITKSSEGLIYNNPLNDTIFVCNESCEAKYVVNFGELKCPEDVKKSMGKVPQLLNYSYLNNKIYISNQKLVFPFTYKLREYTAYYDKKSKKVINNINMDSIVFSIMRPPIGLNVETDKFFSYISKDFVDMAKNRDPKILEKLRKKNEELFTLLENLKDEDNPILVSYSFK